ncbi:hypothetical protein AAY86_00670 [Pseudomonas amygdali pv. tabaci str. ATCC 11528]|nr:hypothetical protein C1E_0211765 [Pseudomonas amygdali pv. tabaci str. ATCC 11528]KKY54667.1 hypothetical protein AAY86_00670 [Pseudomonas amygdali pv. tabaci str. ATCC 11528]QED83716.1 hypothetical protein PSYTB_08520 [Pseudomonas amygdali pv. tabaci str. ATCC 11528]
MSMASHMKGLERALKKRQLQQSGASGIKNEILTLRAKIVEMKSKLQAITTRLAQVNSQIASLSGILAARNDTSSQRKATVDNIVQGPLEPKNPLSTPPAKQLTTADLILQRLIEKRYGKRS